MGEVEVGGGTAAAVNRDCLPASIYNGCGSRAYGLVGASIRVARTPDDFIVGEVGLQLQERLARCPTRSLQRGPVNVSVDFPAVALLLSSFFKKASARLP